jgi:hypothetical protein
MGIVMTEPSLPKTRSSPEDVFIRWVIYTQVGSIAVGPLIAYLPTEHSQVLQAVFFAAFMWLMLSCYVYPIIILAWTIGCGKRLRERLLVFLTGAILLYVQAGVVIALH